MDAQYAAGSPLEWSLLSGPLPAGVTALGAAGLVYLLVRRGRGWWVRRMLPVVVVTLVVTAATVGYVDHVWRPFPDRLPLPVVGWMGLGLLGITLGAMRVRRGPWWRPVAAVACALAVVATAAVQVNVHFGHYPVVRSALGRPPRIMGGLPDLGEHQPTASSSVASRPLAVTWSPPPDMPGTGRVAEVHIPGTVSGFRARSAWTYLPPAYLSSTRPTLPVLVLLAGQPGSPRDWFDGGRLDTVLEGFAKRHRGLAPVVVVPDDLGAPLNNPLCVDSRLGKVETYLARDVPDWIVTHLKVDADRRHWGIAGYSHGGTCALQLAVRRPDLFPNFIDVSGQKEPTLGDRAHTLAAAFNGDKAAFAAANPLDILATRRFRDTAGFFAVGRDDREYLPQQRAVAEACRHAGMRVDAVEMPGGHTWAVWGPGFARGLDALAGRLGLTA
jgi:enterochelin esterase-like enzyme